MATQIDLTKATERAWEVLEHDLARRIDQLGPGESIKLTLDGAEREAFPGTPHVHVYWWADQRVVAAPRNRLLAEPYKLSKAQRQALERLGWFKDLGGPHYLSAAESGALTAGQVVHTLREVWGIPHPAFLIDDADLVEADISSRSRTERGGRGPVPPRRDPKIQLLWEQVEHVIETCDAQSLDYDADGDLGLVIGPSVVFVRVPTADRIHIFAHLVLDIEDFRLAGHELHVLNRDVPHLKFLLTGDILSMHYTVMADPFVDSQLAEVLAVAGRVAGHTAPDVAVRLRGRCFLEPSTHD